MAKVLKVSDVTSEIDKLIKARGDEQKQISSIKSKVEAIINLGDSLKGEGGQAIKNYFKLLHRPALASLDLFFEQYVDALEDIKKKISNYESEIAVVRESFIENDINNALGKIDSTVHEYVEEINKQSNTVSDLIERFAITGDGLHEKVHDAKQTNNKTVEKLNELDEQSKSKLLGKPAHTIQHTSELVNKMKGWTQDGASLKGDQVQEVKTYLETAPINSTLTEAMNPKRNNATNPPDHSKDPGDVARSKNNTTVSNPRESVPKDYQNVSGVQFDNPKDSLGLDADHPMDSVGTLATEGYGAYQAGKQSIIRVKGGSIKKENYTTAQGDKRYRIHVKGKDLYNVKKNSYSNYNLDTGNPAKLKKYVDKGAALKDSFNVKGVSGKLGYAGMALSAGSDIYEGIQNHQSGSKITGNVTSDVTVAGASIAASAAGGAEIGALAGTFVGPVGMAAGLAIGAGVSYLLSGVKPFHGKSIADEISVGTTKAVKGVKHFFGHLF